MAVLCQMLKWKVKQKHSKATLAQLGERQTEVSSVNSSEGLVFDPQKSQNFFFFSFFLFFNSSFRRSHLVLIYQPTHHA